MAVGVFLKFFFYLLNIEINLIPPFRITSFETFLTDFIVFMHMNTQPATVHAGHNRDKTAALHEAANNVLDFLVIMSN